MVGSPTSASRTLMSSLNSENVWSQRLHTGILLKENYFTVWDIIPASFISIFCKFIHTVGVEMKLRKNIKQKV
jgi:hypothetical protein